MRTKPCYRSITPRYLYDDYEEENEFTTLSAYSLRDFFKQPLETLNKPATIIRKQGERYSLETVFDATSPEKGSVYLKEMHSTKEFSVVVANTDLSEADQAFARAAVVYVGQLHGINLELKVSKDAAYLMTESLLNASPKKIEINFDLIWDSWKVENKDVKIEALEFKLKNTPEGLSLIICHKATVFVETEIITED
jgi:hypothetical protein